MKNASEFLHVGLTVSNLDRTIAFYEEYFDFRLDFKMTFPADFIASVPQLYKQKSGVYSDAAFLKSANGIVLELFQFSEMEQAKPAVWNQPGYHHICLKVGDIHECYKKMARDGVEFFFEPAYRGDPKNKEYWVFLKDPDGNLIELQN